jgi:hypothetical protein
LWELRGASGVVADVTRTHSTGARAADVGDARKDAFSLARTDSRARVASVPSSVLVRGSTLAAVWGYAVSQPVFAFLRGSPEFLVLRDATRWDTIAFATILAFGPPLAVITYTWLAGLISRWASDVLYLVMLAAFLVPFAFQLVKPIDPGAQLAIAIVLTLCALTVLAYLRWRAVRIFLAYSVVLPILGLVWFSAGIPTTIDEAEAEPVSLATRPPVVLAVFDELPVNSLMARDGQIDELRYPNFARLAREATWYPNATTVNPFTVKAVPSILTGKEPAEGALPTLGDNPDNLFTLLGGTYELHARETTSRLCPVNLCPRERVSSAESIEVLFQDVRAPYVLKVVPDSVTGAGKGAIPIDGRFGRASSSAVEHFESFLDGLSRGGNSPDLYYTHVLLPHYPWRYLPSGKRYSVPWFDDHLAGSSIWQVDDAVVQGALQRHLVQLQYTDVLLGRLLRRLERLEIYDGALLVVVADHGASFRTGDTLRAVTEEHFADVAGVPLFVKYPGQDRGELDSRPARIVDILPTVADVLGIPLPWRVDGASLLGPPPREGAPAMLREDGEHVRVSMRSLRAQNEALARRNTALFGEGRDSLFAAGVNTALLGTPVDAAVPDSTTLRVDLEDESALARVRTASTFIPAFVAGVVEGGRIDEDAEIAIAVNGRIHALAQPFVDRGEQRFGTLVPEEAFRDGFNLVEAFVVTEERGARRLERVGSNG